MACSSLYFCRATWINSYFLKDDSVVNKLKGIADANVVTTKKRHLGLPEFTELKKYAETCFKENIILLKKFQKKVLKKNILFSYILKFLNQHHTPTYRNYANNNKFTKY